jgi:HEAT repeat protein
MIVLSLARLKASEAADTLIKLLDDPDVQGHAIASLGRLRVVQAREKIKPFLTHPNSWLRREAKKALERIDKSAREH